jgi:hypothetical protein
MPGSILTTLPEHYQTQFGDNWMHLLQQTDSRFKDKVRVENVNGKERTFSQIDSVGPMRLITTRNGKTIPSDSTLAKRWLRVSGYDYVTWLDEWDEIALGNLPAPESEHVVAHARAANRNVDDVIIEAIEGTNYIGETGVTAVDLGSGEQVAVDYVESGSAANSGMTVAKLRRANYLMDLAEVPTDGRFLAMGAQQEQDLLGTTEVGSFDYNAVKALVNGEVNTFMGFTFVQSQRLTLVTSTDVRSALAWQRDGVVLGVGQGRKARLDILPTQNHTIQVRTTEVIGATRLEEARVVEIFCDESP